MKTSHRITLPLLGISACLLNVLTVEAQDSIKVVSNIRVTKELNTVIVTANRKAEFEKYIPAMVHSLQRQQLNRFNPRTTPEALQLINGIFVQKTNHGGGSPFVRGVTGNQVLMLIDGVRINNSTFRYGPNQYLNTIDAFSIQRIEVAKGTGSVQYGSDAIGGVIQIFTTEPSFAEISNHWNGRVTGRYMTGDMEKTIRAESSFSGKQMAVSGGISYRNFGDIIGGDTTGQQDPSGYKELAFDAKLKFRISDDMQLILAHQQVQQQHVPVYHKVNLENFALNEMDPQRRMLSYAKLLTHSDKKLFRNIELIFSHQQSKEGRNSIKNGSTTLRKEKDEVNTIGATADLFSAIAKNWSANSGIELYYDNVKSARQDIITTTGTISDKRGLYPNDSKYGNYSIYTLHHFTFNKWKLESGLRFNTFSISLNDTTLGKVHVTPSALIGNFGISYSFNKQNHIYASFNNAYRAPNIDDMGTLGIVDFRYETPTANLEPERSLNFETGYKFRTERISASAGIYYMKLKNIISRIKVEGEVISGYPVYRKENIEEAYIKGMEAELNFSLTKEWSLYGGASYTYGQNLTRDEPMRRIPPFYGRLMASWKKKQWFAACELVMAAKQKRLAQGDQEDNRIPVGGTPGWELLNVYAGYEWKIIQLNVGVQNIFNEDYRMHGSGVNGYGRSAWINVSVQF